MLWLSQWRARNTISSLQMRPKLSGADESPYGVCTVLRLTCASPSNCASPLPPITASIQALRGAGISRSAQGPDFGQVAPKALRIHAAAENEAVGNAQAHEIGLDRLCRLEHLFHQNGAGEARR